ncbi:MAG: glycosyltransferase [Acidobacteriaceae bacterium]
MKLNSRISVRILAVIVLYKTAPKDSISFQTLQTAMTHAVPGNTLVKIFFYDNTPGGQAAESFPERIHYESHGENRGLADAYNRAMEIARSEGFDWLLTLDQDTSLPVDFVSKLGAAVEFVTPVEYIAAIVPRISDRGRVISPNALRYGIFPKFFPSEFIGISLDKTTSAVNSASALRVSALKSIGGYDPRFWLDYSDAVMYQRLQQNGMRVFVAGNILVEHELSVLDMKNKVSRERYEDILGAESAFWDEYMGKVAGMALLLRFSYRLCYKLWRTGGSPPYFKISLRFLWRRLFYTRKRRIAAWEQSARRRLSTPDRQAEAHGYRR